jgi:hydrogenase 3 maturation protease
MGVKKMWNSSWQESLTRILPPLIRKPTNSVALIGIGNSLRGDDAAGLVAIHQLQQADLPDNLYRIDSGAVPENCTGVLRKIKPALVIFIDAADMGFEPGAVALFDSDQLEQVSGITHSIPFGVLAQYIKTEIGCEVWVLGIQPAQNEVLAPLSDVVQGAVERIIDFFEGLERP